MALDPIYDTRKLKDFADPDLYNYLMSGASRVANYGGTPVPMKDLYMQRANLATRGTQDQERPWWMQGLDVLGSVGGVVTNQVANWTDPNLDWKDIPFAESLGQLGSGAWDYLKENPISSIATLGIAPVLGGLQNVGEKSKRGSEIFSNIFGEQQEADQPYTIGSFFKGQKGAFDLRDLGEFITDVGLDPLTYATLGGSAVVKAGAAARAAEAANVATKAGLAVTGKESVEELGNLLRGKYFDEAKASPNRYAQVNPDKVANLKADKALKQIEDAGKIAQRKAQNAVISLDIPFTNITRQFGNKANIPLIGKYLVQNAPKIDANGAMAVRKLFEQFNVSPESQQKILKQFGVENPADLTIAAFTELRNRFMQAEQALKSRGIPDIQTEFASKLVDDIVNKPFDVEKFLAQYSPEAQAAVGGYVRNAFADTQEGMLAPAANFIEDLDTRLTRNEQLAGTVPESIRDFAGANATVRTPYSPQAVSTKLGNAFDELRHYEQQLGMAVPDRQKAFDELITYINQRGANVDDIAKLIQDDITAAKSLLSDQRMTSFEAGKTMIQRLTDAGHSREIAKQLDEMAFYMSKLQKITMEQAYAKLLRSGKALTDPAVVARLAKNSSKVKSELQKLKDRYTKRFGVKSLDAKGNPKYTLAKDAVYKVPKDTKPAPATKAGVPKSQTYGKPLKESDATSRQAMQPIQIPSVEAFEKPLVKELDKMADDLQKQAASPRYEKVLDDAGEAKQIDIGVQRAVKKDGAAVVKPATKTVGSEATSLLMRGGKFEEGATGVSRLGEALRNIKFVRAINPRTLGTGVAFFDRIGGMIQDARTTARGSANFLMRSVNALHNKAASLTAEELAAVPYVVQRSFPEGKTAEEFFKGTGMNVDKINEVAADMKSLLDRIGKNDTKSGVELVKDLQQDFFPHFAAKSTEEIQTKLEKLAKDADLSDILQNKTSPSSWQSLAQVDNIVAQLQKKLEGLTDPEQIAQLESKIKQVSDLFERDPMQSLMNYIHIATRRQAMTDLFKQLKFDNMVVNGKRADYIRMSTRDARSLGLDRYMKQFPDGMYVHKDLLNGLRKVGDVFSDENLNKFMRTLEDVTRIWRQFTYILIPKHYVNNFIGNVFNAGMAGVTKDAYKQSADLLKKFREGTASKAEMDLIEQAYKDGVIGHGFTAELKQYNPFIKEEPNKLQQINNWIENTYYSKKLRGGGEAIEDFTRLALYKHVLNTTGSREAAAQAVRKYLFNYHEATKTDKMIRTAMLPFWLWTKNNMPLQVSELLRQPRYFLTANNLREATFGDDIDNEKPYIRDKYINLFGMKIPFALPMYDPNQYGGVTESFKSIASSLNPFVRAPLELGMNEQFFNGSRISRGKEPTSEELTNYLARTFGGFGGSAYLDTQRSLKEGKTVPENVATRTLPSFLIGTPARE